MTDQDLAGLPPRPCPKCTAMLAYVRREGQLLEVCTQCRGVWFDPGELTALLEVYRRVDATGGAETTTRCPRCTTPLREVPFPGTDVLVDRCPGCQGIWLDGGELERLQAALAAVVQRASVTDPAAAPSPVLGDAGSSAGRALAVITDAAVAAERRSTCPSCGAGLWALRKEGHTLEQCSRCGGTWFDAGELTASVGVYRRVDPRSGAETPRSCLRCGTRLREALFPGTPVKIDACPACNGTWLEKGELEALRAAVAPLVTPERDLKERARELKLDAKPAEQRGCPRCDAALESHPTRGVAQAERCSKCHGTWLDAGLLSICLGVSRKLRVSDGKPTTRLCARCPQQALSELTYPGTAVQIDVCPDCRATWLDPGKLDELVGLVAR